MFDMEGPSVASVASTTGSDGGPYISDKLPEATRCNCLHYYTGSFPGKYLLPSLGRLSDHQRPLGTSVPRIRILQPYEYVH